MDNPIALKKFVADFEQLAGPKVLVHGGGKEATRLSQKLDIPTNMIDGRRVTDRDTLDVVTMVYAGLVNKRVVSQLQAAGCNAIGLTGADGNAVKATRRAPAPIDYGYVGDIDPRNVNVGLLKSLLDLGLVPVVCAIMHDGDGTLLNCNADSVASAVAKALSTVQSVRLTFCFEKKGVLADVDDDSSVIPLIDRNNYSDLRSAGVVNKGMIPKIDNAFSAIDYGVENVRICHSDDLLKNSGTTICQ